MKHLLILAAAIAAIGIPSVVFAAEYPDRVAVRGQEQQPMPGVLWPERWPGQPIPMRTDKPWLVDLPQLPSPLPSPDKLYGLPTWHPICPADKPRAVPVGVIDTDGRGSAQTSTFRLVNNGPLYRCLALRPGAPVPPVTAQPHASTPSTPAPVTPPSVKPGWGCGDTNHVHIGPHGVSPCKSVPPDFTGAPHTRPTGRSRG